VAASFLFSLKPGDVFTLGSSTQWKVRPYRGYDGTAAYVTKVGTKGTKQYSVSATSIYADGTLGVYPVLNTTRIGPDDDRGVPRREFT
jgi:hypothetical protein